MVILLQFNKTNEMQGAHGLDKELRTMSGGGGSGLFHWISELESVEDGPSYKLAELVFRYLASSPAEQLAEVVWKPDHSGASPIHWAAQSGALHILKRILTDKLVELASLLTNSTPQAEDSMETDESPFNDPVNCIDDKNETPLYWAALAGRTEV